MLGAVVGKTAGVVVTGLAGAVALEGAKKVVAGTTVRSAAVAVTSWGLRAVRAAEYGAEKARLTGADIVSEARGRLGEQTPPPGVAVDHGHGH